MDIEHLRIARDVLESRISRLLEREMNDFVEATGVHVINIKVNFSEYSEYGSTKPRIVVGPTTVTLDI